MDFTVRESGGSVFFTLAGKHGAAVLFVYQDSNDGGYWKIREAGVHTPAPDSIYVPHEAGTCPFTKGGACLYVHATMAQKSGAMVAWIDSHDHDVIRAIMTDWYQQYVGQE